MDPLELFQNPWETHRWNKHVTKEVTKYWTSLLINSASTYPSLDDLDLSKLSLTSPHAIWAAASSNPVSVMKATVVTWLLLNVYKTGERLYKMKKVKSSECLLCSSPLDNQLHFTLQCHELEEIRTQYFEKFVQSCPSIKNYLGNEKLLLQILLDPFSSKVPVEVRNGWSSSDEAYKLSRNYFYHIHKKREKIINNLTKNQPNNANNHEPEDKTEIIITMYENIV